MNVEQLRQKAAWVRRETLRLHGLAPETRVASALSCVELLTVLAYGGYLRLTPTAPGSPRRDRFIISKGHGGISFYPILADLGFIAPAELARICMPSGLLKAIPDPLIPGFETVNGSLGHGLGVGTGVAMMLRHRRDPERVVVLIGDGELNEGAVWEAVMLAAAQTVANLTLIIDANGASMMNFCRNIIDLSPIDARLEAFGWQTVSVSDGHSVPALIEGFDALGRAPGPRALVAHTVKGKGVPRLEGDPMSHIRSLDATEIAELIGEMS